MNNRKEVRSGQARTGRLSGRLLQAFKLFASSFLGVLVPGSASAATLAGNLSGSLDQTAQAFAVTATVTIPFGDTFTIPPGAKLCFAPGTSMIVEGYLIVQGEEGKPVTFSSCDPKKRWSGIRFNTSKRVGGKLSRLRYAIIEYADRAAPASAPIGAEHKGGGIAFDHADAEIERTTVRFNSATVGGGIYIGAGSAVTVTESVIHSNSATGSSFIYSGGGGVYIEASGDSLVTFARNVVALNDFLAPSYGNEEGGGGLYLSGQRRVRILFNLFVANRSGKGPGALVLATGNGTSSHLGSLFYGNIFVANHGAFNFEQVALQTRYSFETVVFPDVWTENAGQFPFVAHLNRNSLVRYVNYGQKLLTSRLFSDGGPDEEERRFLSGAARSREAIAAALAEASTLAPICGSLAAFGPIPRCGSMPVSWHSYLEETVAATPDPNLITLLHAAFSTSSDRTATQRAADLLDYATTIDAGKSVAPLPEAFARITAKVIDPAEILADIKASQPTDHRGLGPAMWLALLGNDVAFSTLLNLADAELTDNLLDQATRNRFEDVAVRIFESRRQQMFANSRKKLYELLGEASRTGQSRLATALLDAGIDPNFPHLGRYPLTAAAEDGHVETVILLLRRGARAASPAPDPASNDAGIPPIYAALAWYHLGAGFKEVAELVIAAGADFGPDGPPSGVYPQLLLLRSWATAGFPTDDARWQSLLTEASKNAQSELDRGILDDFSAGRVHPDPVISAIRQFRNLSTDEVIAKIGSAEEQVDLIALYRILESRRFDITDAGRRTLWDRYDIKRYPRLIREVRLDHVLALYQEAPIKDAIVAKGGAASGGGEGVLTPAVLPYRRKFAVVIGISDYEAFPDPHSVPQGYDGLPDLQWAAKDAVDVARLVRSRRFGEGWEVIDLVGAQATRPKVDTALSTVATAAGENDLVLFFFSGHGWTASGTPDQVHLLLQDSDLKDLDATALRLRALREWAIGLKAKYVVLLLDACHAGLLGAAKGDSAGLSYVELETKQQAENIKPGKVALTSNLGGGLSYEDPDNQNGFFTRFLIQALEGGSVRPRKGNLLTVNDIYDALAAELPIAVRRNRPGRTQSPGFVPLGGSDLLDFPLVPAT